MGQVLVHEVQKGCVVLPKGTPDTLNIPSVDPPARNMDVMAFALLAAIWDRKAKATLRMTEWFKCRVCSLVTSWDHYGLLIIPRILHVSQKSPILLKSLFLLLYIQPYLLRRAGGQGSCTVTDV